MNRTPGVASFAKSLALFASAMLGTADAQDFFTYDAAAIGNGFLQPVPIENSSNASAIADTLTSNDANGFPMAVRVRGLLTNVAARAVIRDLPLDRVFNDFTGPDRITFAAATSKLAATTPASRNVFVGQFNQYPNAELDTTRPATLGGSQNPRFADLPTKTDFTASRGRAKRQMALPVLFPGSPDFRNPAQGNSAAPNIRAALFMLPIQRFTFASLGARGMKDPLKKTPALFAIPALLPRVKLLPIVSRFNNYGNVALGGLPSGSGTFVQNAATPSNAQLLSRGDYQMMVLHLRMRGAEGAVLFNTTDCVIGYSPAQHRDDTLTGWNGSAVADEIFARGKYAFANLSNLIGDDGPNSADEAPRSTEVAGAVWSGVYDRAGVDRRLVILASNLGNVQKHIDLPKIGRKPVSIDPASENPDNFFVSPGQHRLFEFHLEGGVWVLDADAFTGLDNNRNGVGVGAADPP